MRLLLGFALTIALGFGIYFVATATRPTADAPQSTWPVATPTQEGFDAARFTRAVNRIQREHGSILALLVVRHGRLVYEGYYHGTARNTAFDLYSITKSVTSAVVGVAIAHHRIAGAASPVRRFLRGVPRNASRITLGELLTMTSGWPGDGDPRNDVGDPPNLVRALLRRPIVRRPGTHFAYDTSSSHLLSAVLSHATGMSEEAYAERYLLRPLRIRLAEFWPKDNQGYTFGGNGLTLFARDAAKLGQLYLQRGRWNGRRLIPAAWVQASTRPHVSLSPDRGYGYDWWTFRRRHVSGYTAIGFGGQFIAVIPEKDLVVTVFADPAGVTPRITSLLYDDLLPTIRN